MSGSDANADGYGQKQTAMESEQEGQQPRAGIGISCQQARTQERAPGERLYHERPSSNPPGRHLPGQFRWPTWKFERFNDTEPQGVPPSQQWQQECTGMDPYQHQSEQPPHDGCRNHVGS
jgi:hypothetical protein